MPNKISLGEIKVEYEKDNSNINNIYDKLVIIGPESFSSFEEYSSAMEYIIKNYVQYNDYLHSNNLLQIYRTHSLNNGKPLDEQEWYNYYLLKVISKRSIKYFLDNPASFWEKVYYLAEKGLNYITRLDNLLVDVLEFYKDEYVSFPSYLHNSLLNFVKYYLSNKSYSPIITSHIKEISKLLSSTDESKVKEIYSNLESKNIDAFDYDSNNQSDYIEREKEEAYYGDIRLDDSDKDKKILIVGDDKFIHNTTIIYGIAKDYNVDKNQLEFFTDYTKIKTEGANITKRTQWNEKYIGIIFGSTPHSTSGNDGASSLISLCTTEQGFPHCEICSPSNNSGRPKITKQSFKNALRRIIVAYKSSFAD